MSPAFPSLIFDYSSVAAEVSARLKLLVKMGKLPDLDMDLEFSTNVVKLAVLDTVDYNLHRLIGIGRTNRMEMYIDIHCKAHVASGKLKKVLLDSKNITHVGVITEVDCLTMLKLFAKGDIPSIYTRLQFTDKNYRDWVVACIEETWPYKRVYDEMSNGDKVASKENTIIDNIHANISDITVLSDYCESILGYLDDNPFNLWVIEEIGINTVLARSEGDYRLIEWNEEHFKNSVYIP